MVIRITPMPYGDCFILQWDSVSGEKRTVIFDSGTQEAYRKHIRTFLAQLASDIDLWVISHAHSDHIGGVLKFADDKNGGILNLGCKRWMFNFTENSTSVIPCNEASIAESVRQGSKLTEYLRGLGVSSKDCAVTAGVTYSIDDVKFTILSPSPERLIKDISELGPASFAASYSTDYNKTLASFNDNLFVEDTNVVNASSIAVMVEFSDKKFLWLSDACPSDMFSSLKALGYSKLKPLICDYMTLPHHGSKGNTSNELLELVRCNKYIVTADGDNIYNLPNKETLVRTILYNRSHPESDMEFIFPSSSNTPHQIFAVDGESVYEDYGFCIKTGVTVLDI